MSIPYDLNAEHDYKVLPHTMLRFCNGTCQGSLHNIRDT